MIVPPSKYSLARVRAWSLVLMVAFQSILPATTLANSYAGRTRTIATPRFTGIKALIDQDSTPAVPADGGASSSNFWIGLDDQGADGDFDWVQIGWSREDAGGGVLSKRAYAEYNCAGTHSLVFFALPAGLTPEYEVALTGGNWVWTAGGTVLGTGKGDQNCHKKFCTAQAKAEMIPSDANVNCVGTVGNNACIRLIQTKINGGAYANDNLGPNATSGLTTNNVHIQNGANPNSFCVWDDRNPPGSIATARGKAAVEDAVQREPSAAVAK